MPMSQVVARAIISVSGSAMSALAASQGYPWEECDRILWSVGGRHARVGVVRMNDPLNEYRNLMFQPTPVLTSIGSD